MFVAKGFSQREGVEYEETFAPIARYTSIQVVISIASVFGRQIHQMDVKTTFSNGVIEDEVYIEYP
jgi:hypothetical protein